MASLALVGQEYASDILSAGEPPDAVLEFRTLHNAIVGHFCPRVKSGLVNVSIDVIGGGSRSFIVVEYPYESVVSGHNVPRDVFRMRLAADLYLSLRRNCRYAHLDSAGC